MNAKKVISAVTSIFGACLLLALAACEQPVGAIDNSPSKKPSENPGADQPKDQPPAQPQNPVPVPNRKTAATEDELAKWLEDETVTEITLTFADTPILIKTDTAAALRNEVTELAIKTAAGIKKTIIGKEGQSTQTLKTNGNCLIVDGDVILQNFAIDVDAGFPGGSTRPSSSVLATVQNPFIVSGSLTLGDKSSLTLADGVMTQSGSGNAKLVIESGGRLIDSEESITKISELGIWKAGFSQATIKTNAAGTVDGILEMAAEFFTGPTTSSPKLDLAATTVTNPLVISRSGNAYRITANAPADVVDYSWLGAGDTFAINSGTLNLLENFAIAADQTLNVISGTVNIAAEKTLTVNGTLRAEANARVILMEHASTGGTLTMENGSTLITAPTAAIVVKQKGKMILSNALAKVEHDGSITVENEGEIKDAKSGGGQLWNDGSGGGARRGSLRIELGGTGTISEAEIVGATGLVRLTANGNVGTPEYVELAGPNTTTLHGTAELHGPYGIGAGGSLNIHNNSELIIDSDGSGELTLKYDSVSEKGVTVILGGRSDSATASNITVNDGGTLIDQRPFANGAGTEYYLWPISGYTFQGTANRPLITIVKGGIVKTSSGAVVIDDAADGNSGRLNLEAGSFQVLSSVGDLALTGDATQKSNVWLSKKLTLENGASLTIDGVRLFVHCANFSALPNRLIGTNNSTIRLSNASSFLGWTDNPVARSNETLTWQGSSW